MQKEAASTVSVRVSPELRNRTESLADELDRPIQYVMVEALTQYLDRAEKRQAIRKECVAAHEEFARTGLHLTGDEVDTWVDELLKGNSKAELPKCHV